MSPDPIGGAGLLFRIGPGYLVLSVLLVACAVVQVVREPWISDFWEHAAVVRELSREPWNPRHPQLDLEAPDAFISPYSLMVTGLSGLSGFPARGGSDPVRALGIAGIANLLLLLAGLRMFVGALAPARAPRAAFYALLFALFLWGRYPWVYSGFLNVASLAYVLPYPSTFAVGLAMLTLGVWNRAITGGSNPLTRTPLVAVLAAAVLVTHPPAFLFLAAGLAALAWNARAGVRPWALLGIVVAVAAGLAAAWPYYPFFELVTSAQASFHASNRYMYFRVLERTFPALAAVPLVFWSLRSNRRHPILVMCLALSAVYVWGWKTAQWNLGRAIPFLVLLCQVQLAISLAALEAKRPGLRFVGPVVAVVACLLSSWWWQIEPAMIAARADRNMRSELGFLSERVGPDDVVMTDLDTGWVVPAFSGKIVASRHPVAFVPGHADRLGDVARFFDVGASAAEREATIRKYRVRFVLVDEKKASAPLDRALAELGRTVGGNERYRLIEAAR